MKDTTGSLAMEPCDLSFPPPTIPVHGDKLGMTGTLSTPFLPFLPTGCGTPIQRSQETSFPIAKLDSPAPSKMLAPTRRGAKTVVL